MVRSASTHERNVKWLSTKLRKYYPSLYYTILYFYNDKKSESNRLVNSTNSVYSDAYRSKEKPERTESEWILSIDPLPPNLGFLQPKYTLRIPNLDSAAAHIMHGSHVT